MTIEKSVYNFKDDGTLITMPENILIPNVKPRTGLHVKLKGRCCLAVYVQSSETDFGSFFVHNLIYLMYIWFKIARTP